VAVGATGRHKAFGWEGELLSLDRGQAEVKVRGKRFRCAEVELVPVADAGTKRAKRQTPFGTRRRPGVGLDLADGPSETPQELHLLGERVEPALKRLDDYLDRALLGTRNELRVVHGHGSGQLKKAVRKHLRGHPAVATQRPGEPNEGGDGATVVTLAER
jgi:DNA mismatch repair protein MutS2